MKAKKFLKFFTLVVISILFSSGCSFTGYSQSTQTSNYGQPIHTIQGETHTSPLNNQTVNDVHGVVTAVRADGFYLQDTDPDQNDKTSEGILVITESSPIIKTGDEVLVSGTVAEYYPGGIATGNLSITEIIKPRIDIISKGMLNVTPTVIGRNGRIPPVQMIKSDNDSFDPVANGVDFYESMESMLVQVNQAVVVGPTNGYKEIAVLADSGLDAALRTPRGGIVIRKDDFNPERIIIDDLLTALPEVNVGDTFTQPLVGVLDYSFGNFKLQLTQRPSYQTAHLEKEIAPDPTLAELSIAALNVQNLDPGDGKSRFADFAQLIVVNLKSPDIISLDEIQDNNGPIDDQITDASQTFRVLIEAIKNAGGPLYEFREVAPERGQDGGEPGGNIRVGFLFRTDRGLQFIDRGRGTASDAVGIVVGQNSLELSLSPGRIDPQNSAFDNSRKPLVGEFLYRGQKMFLIGVHLNSKGEDSPLFGRYQPPVLSSEKQRLRQAEIIQGFIVKLLAADANANVLVLGDFNDFQFSAALSKLAGHNMKNLVLTLPENQRYSYVFDGNSQVLDQMLASQTLADKISYYAVVHVNAEFAAIKSLSDHDPILARFILQAK